MKKRVLGILAALFVFAVLLPVGVGAAGTRYGDWSDWSDSTPPSPPSGRGIETDTRSITVVDGHMEYRYGRWVGATINWCKEYGEALHGGTYSIEETAWSATRATDTDTHWLCGHFDWEHPSHVHVSGYDYRGYPMWTRYLVDGYSNPEFYWEETRWVDAVYQTQYRWRYIYYDYTVYFDANGGTTPSFIQKTVTNGDSYSNLPSSTRRNYDLAGWYTLPDGGSVILESDIVNLSGDQTLYAHWTYNPIRYMVTLIPGEGSVIIVNDGETYGPLPTPTREHYEFEGWFTEEGQHITSDSIVIPRDHNLYARWVYATYTVRFMPMGGTVDPHSKTVTYNSPYGELPMPIRDGYDFVGWFDEDGQQVTPETVVQLSANQTLYALWTEIRFNVRDAYSFGNSMRDFGYTSRGPGMGQYPIPSRPFFMIFGESVRTRLLYMREASKAWTGNCAGMASSAALLFAYGQLNPADFGKSNTYSLAIGDRNAEEMPVLTLIEAMQIAQYTDAFGRARQANQIPRGQSLDGLYQTIRDEIAQGRPTLLAIVKEHVGGHALLAVGADGENSILIYDCNHPGELRYMTLSADKTAWRYDMGSHGLWGTDSGGCSISYVPYAVLEDIWGNRGHLQPSSQVLTVNAENVSITNFDGETVASLENGQLMTSADGVYELFDLSMYWPEERSICLPRNEVYTVSTSDDITLSARMTDQHMSAEITTSANTVIFGVSDDERENSVIVQGAAASDTYSITLESDFDDLRHKNVTLTGTGQGESVQVSMNQDGVTFVNCNIESLSLDVCEIVSAARDRDGKLSVTLTNPNRVTLAVSYFDAREKFVSAALQDVAADAGAVSVDIPAGAASARVALFDTDCRPLCTAFEADFNGGAG